MLRKELVDFSMPASEIAVEGGFKDSPCGHSDTWPEVQERFPELRGTEYDAIPRGRVTYRVEDDTFMVLLPSATCRDSGLVGRVMSRFGLSSSKTRVLSDEHYDPPNLS